MKIENVEKTVAKLYGKTEYPMCIRNLKQPLNHRLVLKEVHIVIKFNKDAWLKPYIDMNVNLRKKSKNWLWKRFLSWWIMQFLEKLWKMWENIETTCHNRKKKKIIKYHNQIIIQQSFSHKIYWQSKNKNKYTDEWACLKTTIK